MTPDLPPDFPSLLQDALSARRELFDAPHQAALRLFNGFLEGCPDWVIDLYADTLVIYERRGADQPGALSGAPAPEEAILDLIRAQLPWVRAAVLKSRRRPSAEHPSAATRRGALFFGDQPARRIREHGVWYAVDLMMNQDASFYPDTRGLRAWAIQNLGGKRVLNCFAYTGSLGVAALAGGARQVLQVDLKRAFLDLAQESCRLNGFPIRKTDFITGNFFPVASRLRRAGELFDCVMLDPPFFASSGQGTVDLLSQSERLINKIRPLVADGGWLAAINNALFVSGAEVMQSLEALCAQGYLSLETLIPVPPDMTGYAETRRGSLPVDPAPFNHATKIALLRVRRKS